MSNASTLDSMPPQLRKVAECESYRRKSRMVEISLSGSGEGLGWATSRGYSTTIISSILCKDFVQATCIGT